MLFIKPLRVFIQLRQMSSLKDTEFDSIENTQMKTYLNKTCIWHLGLQVSDSLLQPQSANQRIFSNAGLTESGDVMESRHERSWQHWKFPEA